MRNHFILNDFSKCKTKIYVYEHREQNYFTQHVSLYCCDIISRKFERLVVIHYKRIFFGGFSRHSDLYLKNSQTYILRLCLWRNRTIQTTQILHLRSNKNQTNGMFNCWNYFNSNYLQDKLTQNQKNIQNSMRIVNDHMTFASKNIKTTQKASKILNTW